MLATLSPDIVAAPADDEYGSQGPPSDDDGEGAHENNGSSKLTSPALFSPETQKMHDAVAIRTHAVPCRDLSPEVYS